MTKDIHFQFYHLICKTFCHLGRTNSIKTVLQNCSTKLFFFFDLGHFQFRQNERIIFLSKNYRSKNTAKTESLMPYPCSHFYFDIKFGNRLYSKEKKPSSSLLFSIQFVTKIDIKVKVTTWIRA